MTATIKGNKLTLTAEIATGKDAPLSKAGRSRISLSTNGWKFITDEHGQEYRLSLNLITKTGD